ncbi:MAG: diphosphate--fructose-6-phosphate 1-phosphotransferase, partial [Ruthenibacterium sp.]
MKNVIVGQSGGPTAAINASLAGVFETARALGLGTVYGMRHGIEGLLKGQVIDLSAQLHDSMDVELLKRTPSSFLGSCRFKLPAPGTDDAVYTALFHKLEALEIGYFIYIGGNDSMDTVSKLADFFSEDPEAPMLIGLPKTIDNDLAGTDHTPGYGSAAKYLAVTMDELIQDTAIYAVPSVTIVEVMGRHAGWLTLAAALPKMLGGMKPDIIALPEVTFDEDIFIKNVEKKLKTTQNIVVAVSEGIRDERGQYIGSDAKSGAVDIFGHAYLSGVGKYLERLVGIRIGCKVRSIELNLMQRCAAHLGSLADIEESFQIGEQGVNAAVNGETGKMLAVRRLSDHPYQMECDVI